MCNRARVAGKNAYALICLCRAAANAATGPGIDSIDQILFCSAVDDRAIIASG
jgi:hypothetical protein